jgi:hypothetical protein
MYVAAAASLYQNRRWPRRLSYRFDKFLIDKIFLQNWKKYLKIPLTY